MTSGGQSAGDAASRRNPVIPAAPAPLRTLIIAMSVMCFLSTLAAGSLLLVERAVERWTSQISGQATVQILPAEGRDADADTETAKKLFEGFPGIVSVEALSRNQAEDLLEPWLGRADILDELPIPRLLTLTVDQDNPPDFAAITARLKAELPNASLDTHRRWQEELTTMASTLKWLGICVLAIIAGSAVGLVIYATRTALEANRETIEVLYLVGARDHFIARQVESRFFRAGLRAGLIGFLAGLAVFALFIVFGYVGGPSEIATEVRAMLISTEAQALQGYALLTLVPVLATLICLMTARLATARILRSIF